jgi:hypothetical protein
MIRPNVLGLAGVPLLDADLKKRVDAMAGPLREHLARRDGKAREARRRNRALKQQGAAQVAALQAEQRRLQQERHVLRGGSLTVSVRW